MNQINIPLSCPLYRSLDNNLSKTSLEDAIKQSIPELYAMITTDKTGQLLSYFVSDECTQHCNLSKLKEIAKAVSIRFNIGNFANLAGRLETTINVFEERIMLVREIFQENLLIVLIPKNIEDLSGKLNVFNSLADSQFSKQNITEIHNSLTTIGLKKIPSGKSEFQKLQEIPLKPFNYVLIPKPLKKASEYTNTLRGLHDHGSH